MSTFWMFSSAHYYDIKINTANRTVNEAVDTLTPWNAENIFANRWDDDSLRSFRTTINFRIMKFTLAKSVYHIIIIIKVVKINRFEWILILDLTWLDALQHMRLPGYIQCFSRFQFLETLYPSTPENLYSKYAKYICYLLSSSRLRHEKHSKTFAPY